MANTRSHRPWGLHASPDPMLATRPSGTGLRRPFIKIPKYVQASLIVAFGGLLFGLDTGTIGPVSVMKSFQQYISSSSSTVHGLVVSSILIPAAISSFFAGHLADRLGRPRGITVGALIFGLGAAIEASTVHIAMFFVGRAITGIGEGLFLSTVTVYTCEIAPPTNRGLLTCLGQLGTTIGVFMGYFVAYGTVKLDSTASWRLPLALQSGLAFAYAASCLVLPHSPRWLSQLGRDQEAAAVWARLEIPKPQQEVAQLNGTIPVPGEANGSLELQSASTIGMTETIRSSESMTSGREDNTEGRVDFLRVFAKDVRGRTALGAFVLGMQQLSGIDGVLYYAPLLFSQAGLTAETASFLASGVTALVIMIVTVPGFLLADKWGRRTSAITGGLSMGACMIVIGSLYASDSVHTDHGVARWVVVGAIYIFAACFSVTWALCFRAYPSEIQPPVTRAAATSLAQSVNWITNFFVALITPIILSKSSSGAYFLFGCATLFTVAVCYVFMRETKGKSLESIDESFRDDARETVPAGLTRRMRWHR